MRLNYGALSGESGFFADLLRITQRFLTLAPVWILYQTRQQRKHEKRGEQEFLRASMTQDSMRGHARESERMGAQEQQKREKDASWNTERFSIEWELQLAATNNGITPLTQFPTCVPKE